MLTSLANLKAELEISDNAADATLTRLIAQASAAIGNYCDRDFARAVATDLVAVPLDRAAQTRLILPRAPLISVTSITIEGTTTVIDPATYVIDSAPGAVLYRQLGWSPWSAAQYPNSGSTSAMAGQFREARYLVTYDAGYDDAGSSAGNPASPVPADLERAAIILAAGWYRGRKRDPFVKELEVTGVGRTAYWVGDLPGQPNSGMPSAVTGLLDNYQRLTLA